MSLRNGNSLIARETLFLAACDLIDAGYHEFTEFALTIAAWQRDPARFGMFGFLHHPDHKRVYADLLKMTGTRYKPTYNPLLERLRPNVYTLSRWGWQRHEAMKMEKIT